MAQITRDIAKKDKVDLGDFYLKSPSVQGTVILSNQIGQCLAKIDDLKYLELKFYFTS